MDGWMDAGNDRRAGLGSSPRRHARHGQTRRRPGDLAPHGNLAVSRRRLPVRMGGPVLQSGRLGLVVLWRVQGALGLLRALDTSHLLESPEARVHGLPPRGELARLSVEQGDPGGGARVLSVGTGRRERRRLIAGRPQLVLRSASDPRVERCSFGIQTDGTPVSIAVDDTSERSTRGNSLGSSRTWTSF